MGDYLRVQPLKGRIVVVLNISVAQINMNTPSNALYSSTENQHYLNDLKRSFTIILFNKSTKCFFGREEKTRVPEEKRLGGERRTNKLNPRATPNAVVIPGPHSWKAPFHRNDHLSKLRDLFIPGNFYFKRAF